jgi:UDP-glucose 4-epimerase
MFEDKVVKWLITGGCGFIGSRLLERLLEDPENLVTVYDNLSVGSESALVKAANYEPVKLNRINLIKADILDSEESLKAAVNTDVIVHLAANTGVGPSVEDPKADCTTNVLGTLNLLEAARANKVKKFIFASSGAPVGIVDPPIHEEIVPRPISPYGASKLSGEAYCSVYWHCYGVETVALRFGNVYGPGSKDKASVVAKFIKAILDGKALEIYGDGHQTRDFVFVNDLIAAVIQAAVVDKIGGEVFQIATNSETTLMELVDELMSILPIYDIPAVTVIHSGERQGDVRRNYSDTSKANTILGWRATHTLSEGLRATMEYFLKELRE